MMAGDRAYALCGWATAALYATVGLLSAVEDGNVPLAVFIGAGLAASALNAIITAARRA